VKGDGRRVRSLNPDAIARLPCDDAPADERDDGPGLRVSRGRRITNVDDGGRARGGARVRRSATVARVAETVAVRVFLAGVRELGAIVDRVRDAVAVEVTRDGLRALLRRVVRAHVARVADAVLVRVRLETIGVHGAHGVEDVDAVVLDVGDAVSVLVLRGDALGVGRPEGHARGLVLRRLGLAGVERVDRLACRAERLERVVDRGRAGVDAGALRLAAHAAREGGAAIGAARGEGPRGEEGVVAVEGFPAAEDERDVLDAGLEHRAVVFGLRAVEHGDVGQVPGLERAYHLARAHGRGRVRRDHAPEVGVGEMLPEVLLVELVGAAELARHVHRAGDDPVGAERDGHTGHVEHHDRGRVAVEVHVGPRGPDDARLRRANELGLLRARGHRVDDGCLRLQKVEPPVFTCANELVLGLVVDALGDVREIAREPVDLGARGPAVVVLAARLSQVPREREHVGVGDLDGHALEVLGPVVGVAGEALRAAATGDRRGAAQDVPELGEGLELGVGAAVVREAWAPAPALPVGAVQVARLAVPDRGVVRVREVLVRVHEARRDDAVGAGDDGRVGVSGLRRTIAADTRHASCVDHHLAAPERLPGAEHRALEHHAPRRRTGLRDGARATSGSREGRARALVHLGLRVLAGVRLDLRRRHDHVRGAVAAVAPDVGGIDVRAALVAAGAQGERARGEREDKGHRADDRSSLGSRRRGHGTSKFRAKEDEESACPRKTRADERV
jgi:hypothetical protein